MGNQILFLLARISPTTSDLFRSARKAINSALLIAIFLGIVAPVSSANLNVGDIVVVEGGAYDEIAKFNPDTGEKSLVCKSDLRGMTDLVVGQSGMIYIIGYVLNDESDAVEVMVEMNPETCEETIIVMDPENIPYTSLVGIAAEEDGNIILNCAECGPNQELMVLRVDFDLYSMTVVSAGDFISGALKGVDVGPDGDIYVVASTGPAHLPGVVRIDPEDGTQSRITFSPGGNDDEMISPVDLVIGSDGSIFVYDVRYRGSNLERELRIIEVDPLSGVQSMLNDAGVGTDNSWGNYRGIGISNSGREIYFIDFSVSPGGQAGISKVDLDGTLTPDGQYYRTRVNASDTKVRQPGSGLDVVSATTSALNINPGISGAWFNPSTSGQGQLIDVEPDGNFMFLSWFTFTDNKSNHPFEQRWFTAQGNYEGNTANLGLYETVGGRFDSPQEVTTTLVGTVELTFIDCNRGQLKFSIESEELQGMIPLVRVIPGSGGLCENLATNSTQAVDVNHGMDGAWFDKNTSGQGFFIDANPGLTDEGFIFVSWFTFGDDTASGQRWLTAQGPFMGSRADIGVFETTGGSLNEQEPTETREVGVMSIDFTDCNNALLTYSLTDEGRQGNIQIQRAIPGTDALCRELSRQ